MTGTCVPAGGTGRDGRAEKRLQWEGLKGRQGLGERWVYMTARREGCFEEFLVTRDQSVRGHRRKALGTGKTWKRSPVRNSGGWILDQRRGGKCRGLGVTPRNSSERLILMAQELCGRRGWGTTSGWSRGRGGREAPAKITWNPHLHPIRVSPNLRPKGDPS